MKHIFPHIKKYKLLNISMFVAILLKLFVLDIYIVNGNSMYPTLFNRQIVLIEKLSLYFSEPKVSDIVLFDEDNNNLIKRIIAKENDQLRFTKGELYVNDEMMMEDILPGKSNDQIIPPEYYFVLGDNYSMSVDSRYFGNIHKSKIKGKLLIKLF